MSADDRFRYKNPDNLIVNENAALVCVFSKSSIQLLLKLTIPVVFILGNGTVHFEATKEGLFFFDIKKIHHVAYPRSRN